MSNKDRLKEIVTDFPLSPGVYIMKNKSIGFLYVGKAIKLRNRVQSYLRSQNSGKVELLMSHVETIEYIVTENEYEALLLEHNLIKEHQPKYNILLRDDKTFPMIKITKEEYPRIIKTRKIQDDGGDYYGPYIDVFLINKYLDLIEKSFALRRCKKIKKREHPCLYYHIGRCTAICAGLTSKEEYLSRVKKIKSLLKGHTKTLKKDLLIQMHKFAQQKEYEQAAKIRDSLASIESLETQQNMIDYKDESRNYIGISTHDNKCCIVVVHMKEGRIVDQHTTHLNTFDSVEDSLEQFLLSYYYENALYPEIIFVPFKPSEQVETFFSQFETKIQTPQDAKDSAIIRFAKENARFGINQHLRERGDSDSVKHLQKSLYLENPPLRIEGFDIAHIAGMHTTASLVSFYNGVPDKSQYRYFKIKSLPSGKADDFQSLQEAVGRRYTRLKNENKKMPDLILIDGGLGQVNSVKEVLDALELNIPVVGLAKKQEEIFFPGKLYENDSSAIIFSNPLRLPLDDPASKLLQAIRNEAHRFATSFREKKQLDELSLGLYTQVKGIGKKKSKKITEVFSTPKAIADSSIEFLRESLNISEETAKELKDFATHL